MRKARQFLVCQLLLLGIDASATAQGPTRIDLLVSAPESPWQVKRFDTHVPPTRYGRVAWDGVNAIESIADASMALLVRPLAIDLPATPIMCWRWRVDAPLQTADLATKSRDDFAARVYVAFRLPVGAMNFATRSKLRIARSFFGDALPDVAINYVWDNQYPIGTIRPSAYTDRAHLFVLRSGTSAAGSWVSERRDLVADSEKVTGAMPLAAVLIAIGSDTDNTGEHARAGFADIQLTTRDGPCEFPGSPDDLQHPGAPL